MPGGLHNHDLRVMHLQLIFLRVVVGQKVAVIEVLDLVSPIRSLLHFSHGDLLHRKVVFYVVGHFGLAFVDRIQYFLTIPTLPEQLHLQ